MIREKKVGRSNILGTLLGSPNEYYLFSSPKEEISECGCEPLGALRQRHEINMSTKLGV